MSLALAAALGLGLAASGQAGRASVPLSTVDPARVEALLINGGGSAAGNYQSHLMHVRLMADILRESGVPDRRITIVSGDGPDPAADVALREVQPEEDFWLVTGTRLEHAFRTPVRYESSHVPGFALRAATPAEVDRWFTRVGPGLKDGDTLLLYVTDHGTKNAGDVRNNRITASRARSSWTGRKSSARTRSGTRRRRASGSRAGRGPEGPLRRTPELDSRSRRRPRVIRRGPADLGSRRARREHGRRAHRGGSGIHEGLSSIAERRQCKKLLTVPWHEVQK